MKIARKTFETLFVVISFLTGVYFFIPFLSSSLRKAWFANNQLLLFMLALTGSGLTLFFVSSLTGVMDEN